MRDLEQWEKELRLEPDGAPEDAAAQQAAFEQALEKAIDRRIRRICLKTIAAVAIVAAAAFLVINPLMNVFCPNPMELRNSGVSLTAYLRAYYETTQPYTEIISGVEEIEKRGFGRYTVRFQNTDHVGTLAVGRYNAAAEFQYGQFRITESDETSCSTLIPVLVNRFGFYADDEKESVLEKIRELPASSRVYLSVTAPEPVTVESLRQEDITIEWVRIASDSRWQGGLNLAFCTNDGTSPWRSKMDDAALRQQYLDNLSLLLSEPQLTGRRSFWMDDADYSGGVLYPGSLVVQEAYDAVTAQDGPLMTRQYSFFGKRDAVAAYLERTDLVGVYIEAAVLI